MKTAFGHLTYCTNIHPGENWPDHFAALKQHFPSIKSSLSPAIATGIGLRLSNAASLELANAEQLLLFKNWLADNNAYVFTMNGFPYGGFHHTEVKDQVHAPDWTTTERVEYTKRLFTILAQLLPEKMDGGVSTSPLSYRYWFPSDDAMGLAKEIATNHVLEVVEQLIDIHHLTGKILHLDIEPEPDGILETGKEFLEWYQHYLLGTGIKRIALKYGVAHAEAEKMIKRHIALCYDVCHFAIGYESHAEVIKQLAAEGITIGKIQISAALKAALSDDYQMNLKVKEAFASFNEPTYLHQVIVRKNDGSLIRYRDLPAALEDAASLSAEEWRAHFHVPVFEKKFGLLESTRDDIVQVINIHKDSRITNHLEVETYTWEVLADGLKLPIDQSIIRELKWVSDQVI
ncbi:MAG: metabolite traffic protein EboE [Bacteroidota bacterium]|nr:metabolite traffic protein EboE [Bacteroidota bacterium]